MSNLSPAAIALEADLCLLTRLPLPKEADLDAIKERVFGSVEGVPRTEDESRRRYVDAIVDAFDASEAESLEDFPVWVRDLSNGRGTLISTINALNAEMLHRNGLTAKLRQERDQARSDADRYGEGLKAAGANRRTERQEQEQLLANVKAERDEALAHVKRLQEINERLETRNREATQAGASFGVETCGLLAEKDAEIERLRAEHKDLVIVRRRLIDVEADGNHLRTEIAKLKDSAHALTTERDRLAARVREHEETLAVLSNVNADLFKVRQEREALSTTHNRLVEDYDGLKRVYSSICEELNDYREKCAAMKQEQLALDALRKENERLSNDNVSLNDRWQRALNRVQELQAETVEQENSYNHLALVVVDLLKGRGVE